MEVFAEAEMQAVEVACAVEIEPIRVDTKLDIAETEAELRSKS